MRALTALGVRGVCKTKGCDHLPDGASFYGRCWCHMWCAHCDIAEVRVGRVCDTCRQYERTHDGRRRPVELIELQRRRYHDE